VLLVKKEPGGYCKGCECSQGGVGEKGEENGGRTERNKEGSGYTSRRGC